MMVSVPCLAHLHRQQHVLTEEWPLHLHLHLRARVRSRHATTSASTCVTRAASHRPLVSHELACVTPLRTARSQTHRRAPSTSPRLRANLQWTLMHATDRKASSAPHLRAHRPSHRSLVMAPNVSVAIGLQTFELLLIISHLSARSPMLTATAIGTFRSATKRKAISLCVQPGFRPLHRRRPLLCRRSLHRHVVRPSRSPSPPTLH
jgi:hypothetical protein